MSVTHDLTRLTKPPTSKTLAERMATNGGFSPLNLHTFALRHLAGRWGNYSMSDT